MQAKMLGVCGWTPGPWRVDEYKGGRRIVVDAGIIAVPIHIFRNKANAHLIAAAPEMYAALEKARTELMVNSDLDTLAFALDIVRIIDAVLAKARGGS